jgi:hypothetical protein
MRAKILARMSPAYTRSGARITDWFESDRGTVRAPSDWRAGASSAFVVHVPTRTTFEIYTQPGEPSGGSEPLDAFGTRLAHVYTGRPRPVGMALEILQHEAVLMGLYFLGATVFAREGHSAWHPDDHRIPI